MAFRAAFTFLTDCPAQCASRLLVYFKLRQNTGFGGAAAAAPTAATASISPWLIYKPSW